MRERLLGAKWVDGRATAGHQSTKVKTNRQLNEDDAIALELGRMILDALARNATFASAALAAKIAPPIFNRYCNGETYGDHIDGAIRPLGATGRMRSDLSATLFLTEPDEYEGGELIVRDARGDQSVKLPAGSLILYEASSVHRVEPVSKGERVSAIFWIQSIVRHATQRGLLFDLDQTLQGLPDTTENAEAKTALTGHYHNLLRLWADV